MYKLIKAISKVYLYIRAIPKTIFFNFYYLPISQAIRFPILISHRVRFVRLSGKLNLATPPNFAKIRIGFGSVEVSDETRSRAIIRFGKNANITFNGKTKIGTGTKLMIDGNLSFGEAVILSGECSIVCAHEIEIGSYCMISWETLLMDTDLHPILNKDGEITNPNRPIKLEDNVWIGARTTILKGVQIGKGSIVSATSTVVNKNIEAYSLIRGNPAVLIKKIDDKKFIMGDRSIGQQK